MKHFLLLLCILTALTAAADTIRFRSGTILAAELSTKKPVLDNFTPEKLPQDLSGKAYAAVTIKLHPERKLSLMDYKLVCLGLPFDCIAIRTDDGNFDMTTTVDNANPYRKYTLLFLLDAQWAKPNMTDKFVLKSVAGPNNRSETALTFVHRNNQDFTRPSQIPAKGLMKKAAK